MKYEYKGTTGTTEIEVDEHFYDLLVAMDDEEKNSNRRHGRNNPISLENCEYEGAWFENKCDPIKESETAVQWEQAKASLTELQRFCFVEVCLNGRIQQSVADELGVTQQAVDKHIRNARKKLKTFFER